MVIFQQSLEEMLSSRAVTTCLEKHIDYFTILINSPPQTLLVATDFHEYFVDVKCIAESLMPAFQPFVLLGAELVAPRTNRFIDYGNATFSH